MAKSSKPFATTKKKIEYQAGGVAIPFCYLCTIDKVIDGDTLDVTLELFPGVKMQQRVHLFGADAYEMRGKYAEARGKKAREFTQGWIDGAGNVFFRLDVRDVEGGRTFARLYRGSDLRSLNTALGDAKLVKPPKPNRTAKTRKAA